MKNKNILIALFFLIFIIFVFHSPLEGWRLRRGGQILPPPPEGYSSRGEFSYIKIAGKKIQVTLAQTPAEQEQGLSGRAGLKEAEGMLFVFDKPGKYAFWMKDMNFPIDIIWLNEAREVIYIKKDAKPELFPESYGPDGNSKYVLEVVSGFSQMYGLKIGDKAELVY